MSRRTQGTAAGPDRARITAAVTLVDRDGSEPFGARRLAQELGVAPMPIYHHIKGRAALLDAMPEAVFAEVAATSDDGPPAGRKSPARRRTATARWPTGTPGFPLLVTRPGFAGGLSALKGLVTTMREAGLPDQTVADAPGALFSFLNGHLLARTSEGAGAVPAFDATAYPAMAALSPLMAGFGSLTEFGRTLDTVLAEIKDRAAPGPCPCSPRARRLCDGRYQGARSRLAA
ncbi:TetR family transcriptional regulator [Streptomyces sp. NPDC056045]|uniref:TetR family transcriptional regulator n=1 Tax=Streptomyces sp. NPDC056045 TaxID=3345691 RepID=UPI0035DB496E